MEEEKCKVCLASFKPGFLENEKCPICVKLYPDAETPQDRYKKKPKAKEDEGRLETIVKKYIKESLIEYGILHECACGEYFYKRSPAQKTCGKCKGDK